MGKNVRPDEQVAINQSPLDTGRPAMSDPHQSFRNPAEKSAYDAVLIDLVGRPRGNEAAMIFCTPTDPEAAVIADAMVRAGAVSDDLYARLLTVGDRRYDRQPVTRAVAFDAFGSRSDD